MTALVNPLDLTGQRILVTGASSGIGKNTARLLSNLGAELILIGRNRERLEDTLQSLNGGGHAREVFDLAEADSIPPLLKSIAQDQGPLSGSVPFALWFQPGALPPQPRPARRSLL